MCKRMLSFLMVTVLFFVSASALASDEASWTCPTCGTQNNTGNFCGNCGSGRPASDSWTCPTCGTSGLTTDFCTNCGTARGSGASWSCMSCGATGLTTDFCTNCGAKKGTTKALAVGDSVYVGTYEQDNLLFNGEEPIEWIVLSVQNGQAILISKYMLDVKAFNDEKYSAASWAECTLRTWLNDEFLKDAFTEAERATMVKYTTENTEDYVFCLSRSESEYFSAYRSSAFTEYAATKGVFLEDYWLRTYSQLGGWGTQKSELWSDSTKGYTSTLVYTVRGVRPCIVIKCN